MQVAMVYVQVKPEHISDFVAATRANHEASVRENGNRRFDVLQSVEDSVQFVLYEAYATAVDAAAHKQTPHYFQWRAPWRRGWPHRARALPITASFPRVS